MLFLIPAAVGAVALATAGTGLFAGVSAADAYLESKAGKAEADLLLLQSQDLQEAALAEVVAALADYDQVIAAAIDGPLRRLRDLIVASGRHCMVGDFQEIEQLVASGPDFGDPVLGADLLDILLRLGVGVGAGAAVRSGVVALLGTFGATGAGLTGISAIDAVLASVGGGSLVAAGGGAAVSGALLGSLVAGPAVMMVGLGLLQQSSEYDTAVAQYTADVRVFAAQVEQYAQLAPLSVLRIDEMAETALMLAEMLERHLDLLEGRDLADPALLRAVATALALAGALTRLLRTPVFAEDGGLTHASAEATADAQRAAEDAAPVMNEEEQ